MKMRFKTLTLLVAVITSSVSFYAQSEDLLQVYKKAQETNPDLRRAQADRNAAFEKINEARSGLLPQLSAQASYTERRGFRDDRNVNSEIKSGSINLTQSIFDYSIWQGLTIQQKQANVSETSYQAAQQKLILDTATAYFNVLGAIDALEFVEANRKAVFRQLEQTQQQFNVGLVAITDVQNAKAQYDSVIANEVNARNQLDNAIETLRQITGHHFDKLASLNVDTFKTVRPDVAEKLIENANNRNLSLLSARLQQEISRDSIRLAQSGHLPTLGASASSSITDTKNSGSNNPRAGTSNDSGQNSIGLTLSVPLFQGGATVSRTEQAQYGYVSASEALEATARAVEQSVRSSRNNMNASISSINAFEQAVVSAETSLAATEAGYQVGTRTIVDVLNATTTLYNAKQQLSNARYSYMINQLNLLSAQGLLQESDLVSLNATLGKHVSTAPESIIDESAFN
ncbi:outer membrane protein [Thorsellia anophelis DSM 18579]|uniref:Outer membrane protein TolC n=1 Tax=Thorsellia anophelis DSM 18579 TaxID=1123402 RepID=A0A1I0F367_9GAMM|nr:outer membrane channel protein TolC [Thorsellia anophelis]SET52470.1 outer membrane protein [Thorsellia anophelis DSM 18579]